MRMVRPAAVVVVVACAALSACGAGARQNRLISTPIGLFKLHAAHEPVFVRTDDGAWLRVWLDTGATDEWAPAGTIATSADGTARVMEVDAQYVVYDAERGKRVLTALPYATSHRDRTMSPDGKWFALAEARDVTSHGEATVFDIVVVSTVDLTVRRLDSESSSIALRWIGSDQLWFETLRRWRLLDPATGTVTDPPEIPTSLGVGAEDCPAVGLRLHLDDLSDRRDIVAIPIASEANPEQLASATNRILVSAESGKTSWPHGGPPPHILGMASFTRSCLHFIFEFADTVYVGTVADGRFAPLIDGESALSAPPGQ